MLKVEKRRKLRKRKMCFSRKTPLLKGCLQELRSLNRLPKTPPFFREFFKQSEALRFRGWFPTVQLGGSRTYGKDHSHRGGGGGGGCLGFLFAQGKCHEPGPVKATRSVRLDSGRTCCNGRRSECGLPSAADTRLV